MRLKELRGASSQKEMAEAIGIKWNAWARYERGEVCPSADMLAQICIAHACSADWLLGLPERGGTAPRAEGVRPTQPQAVRAPTTKPPQTTQTFPNLPSGDCSRCQLMAAHIREITGRK